MIDPESQKILIAGAGPAGAALAQILRANKIPYEIFDRDTDFSARRGGVFVVDIGLTALDGLLPGDLGDPRVASSNYATGEPDTFAWVSDRKIVMRRAVIPYGEKKFAMAARRGDFRDWMAQHLPVKTGKKMVRYEEDLEGVTVHFTDGSSSRGAMLVGADGANSVIRKQLLNDPEKELSNFVPVTGELEVSREVFSPLLKAANGAVIFLGSDVNLGLFRLSVAPDGSSARYWWVCSFKSTDPHADTAWVQTASQQALFEHVLKIVQPLPPVVSEIVRHTGAAGMWQPQLRFTEWKPPMALPRGRVTLLGDAAHNTTPFGGMGCNTALWDAADLGSLIKEHIAANGSIRSLDDVVEILKQYERDMIPRGQALIEGSRAIVRPKPTNKSGAPADRQVEESPLMLSRKGLMITVDEPFDV